MPEQVSSQEGKSIPSIPELVEQVHDKFNSKRSTFDKGLKREAPYLESSAAVDVVDEIKDSKSLGLKLIAETTLDFPDALGTFDWIDEPKTWDEFFFRIAAEILEGEFKRAHPESDKEADRRIEDFEK